jgi:3-oxoacyl-[acyl-carrier protein] reductase
VHLRRKFMSDSIDGSRILLVTGGSRGIGAATAALAARRGYHVAVNYRADRASAERVVAGIRDLGARLSPSPPTSPTNMT